jgi:tRNA(Ile)-lysidine synthase
MRGARRGGASSFGPQWLERRLRQLLPGFPDVAVCVAFSGGADSTALLYALRQLAHSPASLRALHIDHGLQAGSGRWSRHCRRIARQLRVPFAQRSASIIRARGESLEAAARSERYRLFASVLRPGEALLTAHHQDDQLETVLLQLLRGAGLAGLAAMPEVAALGQGLLVRPLLAVPRAALTTWVRTQRLTWVEDDSNAQLRRDRNYLRGRVLPLIRERWPAAAATVSRSARHAAEAQRLLELLADGDVATASCGASLCASMLRRLPSDRRRNALRFWIGAAGALSPPAARLEEIAGPLLEARADARPRVAWQGASVQREGDLLSLRTEPAAGAAGMPELTWSWRAQRRKVLPAPFGALTLERDRHGPLDLDALGPTLVLGVRRGGERLRPVRGGPRRTLKQLLQEGRVPVDRRSRLPLLFDRGRLIAVADLWLDESVQARATSRHRARLLWRAME